MYVDEIKMARKTEILGPTGKILMPTSFLDHVYLGCTLREYSISNDIVTNYRDMFESRVSDGSKKKLLTKASGKPDAKITSSWSTTWKVMQTIVERHCELEKKTTQQLYKVATPCRMTINLKKRKLSQ